MACNSQSAAEVGTGAGPPSPGEAASGGWGLWLSHGLGATAGSPPRARASLVVCFEACFQWRAPSYVSGLVYLMVAAEPVIQHLCLRMLFAFLVYHSLVPILEGPAQV